MFNDMEEYIKKGQVVGMDHKKLEQFVVADPAEPVL